MSMQGRVGGLGLALLVGMLGMARAVPLTPGTSVAGTVPANGAVQSYEFTATASGQVYVAVYPTSVFLPKLEVYRTDVTPAAKLTLTSLFSGRVSRAAITAGVPYRIDVGRTLGAGNFVLSVYTSPSGVRGALQDSVTTTDALQTGEFQLFAFTPAVTGAYAALVSTDDSVFLPCITLHDATGAKLAPSSDFAAALGPVALTAGQTYFLLVKGTTGVTGGPISLLIYLAAAGQPDLGIRAAGASTYAGLGTFTTVTETRRVRSGEVAAFEFLLINRSTTAETLTLTATLDTATAVTVEYRNQFNQPIAELANGTGLTFPNVAPGVAFRGSVRITLGAGVPGNAARRVTLRAASATLSDTVVARAEKQPLTGVALTFTPLPSVPMGAPVTLVAVPDGGGPCEFLFAKKTGGMWTNLQGTSRQWSPLDRCPWRGYFPGRETFRVYAREVGTTRQFEAVAEYTVAMPLLAVLLAVDPWPSLESLQEVQCTATPLLEGGLTQYKYEVFYRNAAGVYEPYLAGRDFDADPAWTWRASLLPPVLPPILPGLYRITVTARDVNSAQPRDIKASATVLVLPPEDVVHAISP